MQHFMLIGTDLSHWVSGDGGRSYKAVNSDVAFTDARLVADAKIGSLLSSVVGVVAWGISQYYDLSHELVDEQAKLQVSERAHAPTNNPY